MIEPDQPAAGGPAPAAAPRTAGAVLRAAREAQGLHIAALATAIKVTPRMVEALEADRLQELPDTTFARALAQTICRQLKIDPQSVLALLPATGTVALEPASRIRSTPYRDRGGRAEQGPARNLGPLIWGAALLLLAAVALYMLPSAWLGLGPNGAGEPGAPTAASAPLLVEPVASAALGAPAASVPDAAASQAPTSEVASAALMPVMGMAPAADRNLAASAESVFAAPPAGSETAPAVSRVLVVTTTDASWVEVRDAKGQLLLSETVQPGRSVGLDGPLPMRLSIGNAAATQLVFMGRPVDVVARSRENVARFELR
jgi:cytoskeleton protein RodZ